MCVFTQLSLVSIFTPFLPELVVVFRSFLIFLFQTCPTGSTNHLVEARSFHQVSHSFRDPLIVRLQSALERAHQRRLNYSRTVTSERPHKISEATPPVRGKLGLTQRSDPAPPTSSLKSKPLTTPLSRKVSTRRVSSLYYDQGHGLSRCLFAEGPAGLSQTMYNEHVRRITLLSKCH